MKETFSHEFNGWQKLLAKLTTMWRINSDSIDFKWGYFAPRWGLSLVLDRGGYFDQRYGLHIQLIWGALYIHLPFKTRIPESCDTPRYGIAMHNGELWFHLGGKMNSWEQCDSKIVMWRLPFFTWTFDWHRIMLPEGDWPAYDYELCDKAYTETHKYAYTLKSGEVQERLATCFVEERQWHRKWLPLWTMNRRVINISFDDEVGERTGSWKGGTVGCSYDLLKGESIESCLRRMEKERKF